MTETLPSGACPDHEQLAAYADKVLTGEEHREIQRHLADCDDCRELVAEAVHLQPEVVPALAPVIPFWRRRKVQTFGGGILALAAALILMVSVSPELNPFGGPTPYEELVAAVGIDRTVESRLSGGFAYGPLRGPTRSADVGRSSSLRLQAVVGDLRERRNEDASTDVLHALGVGELLLGEYDAAVKSLEGAALAASTDARLQSDLAAAYFARGSELDSREDFARALAAADRAITQNPRLAEAHFNRSLALDALLLSAAAAKSWEKFLSIEPDGPWADEARTHLLTLDPAQLPQPQPDPR